MKKLLVEAVAAKSGLPKKTIAMVLDLLLHEIVATVAGGVSVSLKGFGSFKLKTRAARQFRNPKTGESVLAEGFSTVAFSPSKFLRGRVDVEA